MTPNLSIGKYLDNVWNKAKQDRRQHIFRLLEHQSNITLLDCGCDDGSFSIELGNHIGAKLLIGIEINRIRSLKARQRGIKILESNLNFVFPIADHSIDVVTSDAVIEHMIDLDNFLAEIYRVLKPGGYTIIGTENLSATHNIFALICGNQPYSGPTLSRKEKIGHHPIHPTNYYPYEAEIDEHTRIMAFKAFKEMFLIHGFKVDEVFTSGFFPFPNPIGRLLARLDPWHAAFIGLKAHKPSHGT